MMRAATPEILRTPENGNGMASPDLLNQARLLLAQLEREEPQSSLPLAQLWPTYWATEGQHLTSARRTSDAWAAIRSVVGKDGLALQDRPALSVTSEVVEEMRAQIKTRTTRFDRPPKPATINRYIIVLRRLLNWATEQRRIPYNPLRVKLEDENNVRQTAIRTEKDFNRLLDCCDRYNRALCLLYFDGGLRRCEGIDLQRHQVLRQADGGAWLTLYETKTKQARWVPITRRALAALDALPDNGPYFFANRETKRPYSVRFLYEKFQRAVARSGLQPAPGESITWHCLRSSFCYVRRAVDHLPESTIMAFTGHKTRVAFARYGIVDPQEMASAVGAVERRLAMPQTPTVLPKNER
jgi:integrase